MNREEKKQYLISRFSTNTNFDVAAFEEATDEEIDVLFDMVCKYCDFKKLKNPSIGMIKKRKKCSPRTEFGKWYEKNFQPVCENNSQYNRLRKQYKRGHIDLSKTAEEQGIE